MKTLELLSPIAHAGVLYGKGIHEVLVELAVHFLRTFPLIVRLPEADAQPGATEKWPDADAANIDRIVKRQRAGF